MKPESVWKGRRGEWYIVVQAVLFLLLAVGPRSCRNVTTWEISETSLGSWGGGALCAAGALLAMAGVINLGRNLTPLPLPKENATLIVTGAYRLVRHPIYSGIIFMAFGWGLWLHSWLTLGYACLLAIFFDVKSRFEERLMTEKFPEYAAYRTRVRKLIPFIY